MDVLSTGAYSGGEMGEGAVIVDDIWTFEGRAEAHSAAFSVAVDRYSPVTTALRLTLAGLSRHVPGIRSEPSIRLRVDGKPAGLLDRPGWWSHVVLGDTVRASDGTELRPYLESADDGRTVRCDLYVDGVSLRNGSEIGAVERRRELFEQAIGRGLTNELATGLVGLLLMTVFAITGLALLARGSSNAVQTVVDAMAPVVLAGAGANWLAGREPVHRIGRLGNILLGAMAVLMAGLALVAVAAPLLRG